MLERVWNFRPTWPNQTENIVDLWHYYRLSLILTLCTVLIILKFIRYPQDTKKRSEEYKFIEPTLTAETWDSIQSKEKLVQEKAPRRIVGERKRARPPQEIKLTGEKIQIQIFVFFASLMGTTEKSAKIFVENLTENLKKLENPETCTFLLPKILDLSYIDFDDYFMNFPQERFDTHPFYLFLLPTYNIESVLSNFLVYLNDIHNDFRINTAPLSPILGYSVFGFGDRHEWPTEERGFCSQARQVDKLMARLTGGKRAFPLGMGDNKTDAKNNLEEWKLGIEDVLKYIALTGNLGEGVIGSGDAEESDIEETDEDKVSLRNAKSKPQNERNNVESSHDDLEDIGRNLNLDLTDHTSREVDFTTYALNSTDNLKEMVPKNSPTYAALTKQGYSIIGSHSGVKICRWTKSALRGRGSCYKYSFYGIASHQCMETTPSLSCSNKCVFCWRHGTNPVGTSWRWTVDPPELIFNGVKAEHYKKIKMMRGVPGVRAERFTEAMQIHHCALSLVGEPIFYPYINEFTAMLHAEHISSFLVCNAQHPDQLAALKPVTQLYVSIDASNRESLRKIDRPLHRDFWERFNRCLDILRQRRFEQRTVFRLTLVKGFNIDEIIGYSDLIEKSLPCFVEIKGVTYCGTSLGTGSATLTMKNVPFYEEVCVFVEALNQELCRRNLGYGIAAEHAHSCCVLIASERFKLRGKWHTKIDYAKFFQCLESGEKFTPEDYMGPETPEWATWGKGGFDPRDERIYRKGKNKTQL